MNTRPRAASRPTPLTANEPPREERLKSRPARCADGVLSTRVLIADDEPSILRSTALLLRGFGFETIECPEVACILPKLREHRPQALLQDVRMPGLDVERLVLSIREEPTLSDLPVVLFSAGMDALEIADRLGVRLVEKPFKPDELVQALTTSAKA